MIFQVVAKIKVGEIVVVKIVDMISHATTIETEISIIVVVEDIIGAIIEIILPEVMVVVAAVVVDIIKLQLVQVGDNLRLQKRRK